MMIANGGQSTVNIGRVGKSMYYILFSSSLQSISVDLHVPIISSIPLLSVDDVIQLVKSSKDQGAARLALTSKEYGLSLDQART